MSPTPSALLSPLLLSIPLAAPGPVPQDGSDPSPTVIVVDGDEVSLETFERWLIENQAARHARTFAEFHVIGRAAEERGNDVAPEDVRWELDEEVQIRVDNAFRGDRGGWLDELHRLARTEAGYLRERTLELTATLQASAMVADGRVVPEDKIERDWELLYGPYGRDFELSMIKFQVEVVTPPKGTPWEETVARRERTFAEVRDRALACRERILAGEDFAALARELSEDPLTRASGGRWTEKIRRGTGWPHSFFEELMKLERGEVSMPIYARGGYWIVRADSWVDTPVEAVRASLTERLIAKGPEQDEIGNLWNRLTEGLTVELTPELFNDPSPIEGVTDDPVGLYVNGEPIPRSQFATWLVGYRGEEMVRHFCEHYLVAKKAGSLGIEISDAEVEARVDDYVDWVVKSGYQNDREAWRTYLKKAGRDWDGFLRELRFRERINAMAERMILMEREVSDEEVRMRWEGLYGKDGRRLDVRVITRSVAAPELEEGLSREELAARVQAAVDAVGAEVAELRRRVVEGGEDFAALARTESDDPTTRDLGGRFPGPFIPDAWPQVVARAVLELGEGELTEPVFDGASWHLFELVEVRHVAFEDAADEIRRELLERKPSYAELSVYRNYLLKQTTHELLPAMHE